MELNNLISKLSSKEPESALFIAIELTDDIVLAGVWQVRDGQTEVVHLGSPIPWNEAVAGDISELVAACDTSLTQATEELTTTPTGVIFGIPNHWLVNDKIEDNKKAYIKAITKELELKPLGFVVTIDSLIQYLKKIEGTPLTAILVQVADANLTIAMVTQGKVSHIKTLNRTEDIVADTETGLTSFVEKGVSQFPSRLIVFNGMHDLTEIVENLTLADWASKFNFLHIPKLEQLGKDVVIRAICVAGGGEVARTIGFEINPDEQPKDSQQQVPPPLGFSTSEAHEKLAPQPLPPKPAVSMPKLNFKPSLRIPKFAKPPIALVLALVLIFFSATAVFAMMWVFPKAEVTIYVTPYQETQEFTLQVADTSYKEIESTASGNKSTQTTGTKTTGEKSQGELTIYNRTILKKTFPKGTVLKSGSQSFSLDSETVVASKSAGSDYVDVPGKATTSVTALEIGEKGNLPKDSEFQVGTFATDSYVARNDKSFTGGLSREVDVVSAQDQKLLYETLREELLKEAQSNLSESSEQDLVFFLSEDTTIVSEVYSAKVGQEAKELSLELELSLAGYSFAKSPLLELSRTKLLESLGNQYELTSDPEIELKTGDADSISITASIQAIPKLDAESLARTLAKEKSSTQIESALSQVPGFVKTKITISPTWLPPRFKSLPRKPENIIITVLPESEIVQ